MTALDQLSPDEGYAPHVLDTPAWAALTGPHATFAEGQGGARRYPDDVSPFAAIAPEMRHQDWADLAALLGPGGAAVLATPSTTADRLPAGWTVLNRWPGVQLVATDAVITRPDPEALVLGEVDVPEMLDLVRRTEPGPFLPRTHQLGTYLGVRHEGRLVAMAGERMHPPGFTEISAVCTDPAFQGHGLGSRLIRAVAHGIRERGETPFLHASAANTTAIRLYQKLGFVLRMRPDFLVLQAP